MRQLLFALATLVAVPALAQSSDLQKGDVAPAAASTDGGGKPGLDVNRLPFTQFSIQEVVKFHLPDIQKCYEQVIAEVGGKPPQGRVMVSFSILANGLTSRTKVVQKKTTIKNDRVQDCVTDEVRRWAFPQPNDKREHPIEYPFDLKVQK